MTKMTAEHRDILGACADVANQSTEILLETGAINEENAAQVMMSLIIVQMRAVKGILKSTEATKKAALTIEDDHLQQIIQEIKFARN